MSSSSAFTTRDALRDGSTRRFIDSQVWCRPFHGVRMPLPTEHGELHPAAQRERRIRERVGAYRTIIGPGAFFSHSTAAILWEMPLPPLPDDVIHVSVLAPACAPEGRGVRGHQLKPDGVAVTTGAEGLSLTDPATTWALLGTLLRHPYDLVAAADAVVTGVRVAGPRGRIVQEPLATIEQLQMSLDSAYKRRGIVALRDALPRVRSGAASRTESWTRLVMVDGGLPEPVLNHDVYDVDGFVACVDLAYPDLRVGVEYEGDQHRTDAVQWQRDLERYERLAAAGWRMIRVTREMLFRRPDLLVRLVTDARSRAR
ncbi:MAG: hypothetical protein BGO45_01280 [Microbacterium sp. 71-36]|uniref:endonuclease domain-containing protein n=1 Tax=unclassified Microbacterium TaxID=2609290 RepID=UPI00086E3CB0|nr:MULTISPECIES: hypothetical protein [unclassified Microbacterium]MBN9210600.1 hypothetical protein [Microbacterium sp.]ODT36155.1 MAG: hypothetical protein ABS60_16515 [Microbacterium sp. SCN 71-17]ODU48767.1 MAG: hypothetical protein ABT07_05575 [Microbacterium sp. SCN 70-10]OJV76224.1 MAG: hypothetical protein BGO45_01280 [Microbacterium sp. 71-36]